MTCRPCIDARRKAINVLPARLARPLARLALPAVTTPGEVIRVARTYVGVPFRHQGRSRERGIDCVGLPIMVLSELGAMPETFVDTLHYERAPSRGSLERELRAYCTPLPKPEPGALVAVQWKKEQAHVGIYTGPTLIHAFEWRDTVIEHGFAGRWRRLVVASYALPGVRYG